MSLIIKTTTVEVFFSRFPKPKEHFLPTSSKIKKHAQPKSQNQYVLLIEYADKAILEQIQLESLGKCTINRHKRKPIYTLFYDSNKNTYYLIIIPSFLLRLSSLTPKIHKELTEQNISIIHKNLGLFELEPLHDILMAAISSKPSNNIIMLKDHKASTNLDKPSFDTDHCFTNSHCSILGGLGEETDYHSLPEIQTSFFEEAPYHIVPSFNTNQDSFPFNCISNLETSSLSIFLNFLSEQSFFSTTPELRANTPTPNSEQNLEQQDTDDISHFLNI